MTATGVNFSWISRSNSQFNALEPTHTSKPSMTTTTRCTYCRKKLDIGRDAISAQNGVIGHKRFIPLDDMLIFCCDECVRQHFNGGPKVRPRIP